MRVRVIRTVTALLTWLLSVPSLSAHDEIVHQRMVDLAYQMMVFLRSTDLGRFAAGTPEWQQFQARVAGTPRKYRPRPSGLGELKAPKRSECTLPEKSWDTTLGNVPYSPVWDFDGNDGCGVDQGWKPSLANIGAEDYAGAVLGLWAASIDRGFGDTHLWYRPTNFVGLGKVRDILNDAGDIGLGLALVPIVCLADCIFGSCDDCDKHARKIAADANPTDEIDGWIPGIGDISNGDYVGVWHFIDMKPNAANEFDDRQGKLFDEAGIPNAPMDAVELVLMAYFDVSGLSVNYDKSDGVGRYTANHADDSMSQTIRRDQSQWQFMSIAHVPFEPVDNLAYYGWTQFRDSNQHAVRSLAWPLHALGDATVPMHVTGTSGWGHKPFEDSQVDLWPKIWNLQTGAADANEAQRIAVNRVMLRAFEWSKIIDAWRAEHGGTKDIPVRRLVTEVAANTYAYSIAKHQETLGAWPFSSTASTEYLLFPSKTANEYGAIPGAADLVRPLFEDGLGAIIALLVAAGDYLPTPEEGFAPHDPSIRHARAGAATLAAAAGAR